MKRWTLESPGAGIVLHLLLFSLVVAAVQYSEHRAASVPVAAPASAQAQHVSTSAAQAVPVAGAARPGLPAP